MAKEEHDQERDVNRGSTSATRQQTHFIAMTGAAIPHGGDKPCFVHLLDFISMPVIGSFKKTSRRAASASMRVCFGME